MNPLGFLPTRVHGVLDYAISALLLGSPWFFGFDHGGAETWLPVFLGGLGMLYSLFTDYEWSVRRAIPMVVHLLIDVMAGALVAVSPWLFRFAGVVWKPHLALGISVMVVAALTSTRPTTASVAHVRY